MKYRLVGLLIVVALASVLWSGSVRTQEPNTKAAQTAVEAWLSLIDNQKYAESWDTAATLFRNAVTSEKWQAAVQMARAQFGQLKSRGLKSATPATQLPGVPVGEYVVFQFDTTFEQKPTAVETVTAIREKDGTWHVGGYFIK